MKLASSPLEDDHKIRLLRFNKTKNQHATDTAKSKLYFRCSSRFKQPIIGQNE